jgi:ribosome-associated toxin RatA of RatAB toxin-antitoxin module
VATTINKTALLPHSAKTMFDLVADIASYPEFLPGCSGAQVMEQTENVVVGRLDLSKAGVTQSFVTRNTNTPFTSITLALEDGPFESLGGEWRFDALSDEACRVSLDLTFKLRSGLLKMAASRLFESVANDMVDAMVKRANQLQKEGAS